MSTAKTEALDEAIGLGAAGASTDDVLAYLEMRGWTLERRPACPTCGHSTAPLWFGQPGGGEHSEDDGACITCGPDVGKRCATP